MRGAPEATAAACSLTVLRTSGRHTAAKRLRWDPALGSWTKVNYDAGARFTMEVRPVASLADVAAAVDDLRSDRRAFLVRGAPTREAHLAASMDPNATFRRLKRAKDGTAATLEEVPRRWLMLDVDGWPLPAWADLVDDPEAVVDAAVHDMLPEPFHDARCFWHLSSGAGFDPGVLRAHLFFWLSEPATDGDLRAYFRARAPGVDTAPFNGTQPHFIADPVVERAPDPIPRRTGWREGLAEAVDLPPLDAPALRAESEARRGRVMAAAGLDAHAAGTVDGALALLGDGDGREGFHAPLLRATWLYAEETPPGRRDDAAFKARLRAAVRAARKREHRDASRYLTDAYLDDAIRGADARLAEQRASRPAALDPSGHLNFAAFSGAAAPGTGRGDAAKLDWRTDAAERCLAAALAADMAPERTLAGVAPAYPARPCRPLDDAREVARAVVRAWARQAVRYAAWRDMRWHVRREVDALLAPEAERVGALPPGHPDRAAFAGRRKVELRRVAKAYVARLGAAGWERPEAPPAPLVLALSAGGGKTRMAMEELASAVQEAPVPVTVGWCVQNLGGAAAEAKERLEACGLPTTILRGRGQKGDDGRPMCHRQDLVAKVAAATGGPVAGTLCDDGMGNVCTFKREGRCPFFRQIRAAPVGGALIFTHASLAYPTLPGEVPPPSLTIVDEDPLAHLLEGLEGGVPVARMGHGEVWGVHPIRPQGEDPEERARREEVNAVCDAAGRVLDALDGRGTGFREALEAEGMTLDRLAAAAEAAEGMANVGRAAKPSDHDDDIREAVEGRDLATRRKLAGVLRAIAADWRAGRADLQRVAMRPAEGDGEPVRMARVMGTRAILRRERRALAVLDANARGDLLRPVLGDGMPPVVRVEAPRFALVEQVVGVSFSKTGTFALKEAPAAKDRLRAANLTAALMGAITDLVALYAPGRVLVVAPKAVRRLLTGEGAAGDLPTTVEHAGAVWAHYGRLRGLDEFRHFAAVVLIGREQPPPQAAEDQARALFADDPEPLELPEDYVRLPRGFRMRDGRRLGAGVWCHPDGRAQALLERSREDEMGQAMDRLRPVAREADPPRIYLLGEVPCDVEVDRITGFDAWRRLLALEVMERRGGGEVVFTEEWIGREAPGALGRRDGRALGRSQGIAVLNGLVLAALVKLAGELRDELVRFPNRRIPNGETGQLSRFAWALLKGKQDGVLARLPTLDGDVPAVIAAAAGRAVRDWVPLAPMLRQAVEEAGTLRSRTEAARTMTWLEEHQWLFPYVDPDGPEGRAAIAATAASEWQGRYARWFASLPDGAGTRLLEEGQAREVVESPALVLLTEWITPVLADRALAVLRTDPAAFWRVFHMPCEEARGDGAEMAVRFVAGEARRIAEAPHVRFLTPRAWVAVVAVAAEALATMRREPGGHA